MRATRASSSRSARGPSPRTSGSYARWARSWATTISLRLDANRAWGYEEAAEFVVARGRASSTSRSRSPTPRGCRELVREFGVPVALDESLVGMEPEELEEHRYARAVVLKPTLLGGISRTLAHGRAGAPPRHDARRQFGLREWRRDGGPRGAGGGHRRPPCSCWAGHVSRAGGRRSRDAARPAGPNVDVGRRRTPRVR